LAHVERRLQIAQLSVQSQKGVLGQLFGIFPAPGQTRGHAEYPRLVLADKADKSSGIATTGRSEFVIRRLADLRIGRRRRQFEG
jgi:hypothetical protein